MKMTSEELFKDVIDFAKKKQDEWNQERIKTPDFNEKQFYAGGEASIKALVRELKDRHKVDI